MAQAAVVPTLARRRGLSLARQEALVGYLFLVPWLIGLTVFVAIPILGAVMLSFTPYSLGRPVTFNGIDNYVRAFTNDAQFYNSIRRTFTWALS